MRRLNASVFAVAVAVTAPVFAESHECSIENFEVRYGFQGLGFDTRNSPATPLALAGVIVADGEGTITYWADYAHFDLPGGPPKTTEENDMVAVVASAGGKVTYSVESDCRMTITIPLPAPAPILKLQGVLVEGGRTAQLLTGSPAYVGTWTAKKADDSAADALKDTRDLVRRIAAAQGILRWQDVEE